jgi:hypothetical protein
MSTRTTLLSRKRMGRAFIAFALVLSMAVAVFAGCGEDNYVVGGKCATGFTQCGVACIDVQSDPLNCGSCGNVCPSGLACGAGICGGPTDATMDGVGDARPTDGGDGGNGEAGDGGDDGGDGSSFDGPNEDGRMGDGGDGGGGDGGDGGVCTPPFDTVQHCGDCFTQCVAPNDTCKPSDGGFACAPFCVAPLVNCGGICIDVTADPFNCGACNHICPTFLCANSTCVNGFNGEFVLIGHDFATTVPNPGSQVKVLTNSVFIRPSSPLRVLAYQRYALGPAVTRVTGIITAYAAQISRTLTLTTTVVDGDIPARLNVSDFDVLLVYDQATAPTGALGALGTSWANTLTTYVGAGGLVIVLDGSGSDAIDAGASEMPQLITNAALLNVTSQVPLPQGTRVRNIAPGDSVGSNVGAQYGTTLDSARFAADPPSATITYVIFDQPDGQPVVIHRTF